MNQLLPSLLFCLLAASSAAAAASPDGAWTPEAIRQRLRLLEHGTDAERQTAMNGMLVGMVTPEFRGPLLTILRDESADIRTRVTAARTLIYHRRFANDADLEAAVMVLASGLSDKDSDVREDALEFLHDAGPAQRFAADALLRLIEDAPQGEVRQELLDLVMRGLHSATAEALSPGLRKLLDAPDREVAVTAHSVLRFVDPDAVPSPALVQKHVPHYVDQMKRGDVEAGFLAMMRLYEIGPEAADAIPDIVRFVARTRHEKEYQDAGLYIASMPFYFRDAAIPHLLKLMDEEEEEETACLAGVLLGNARSAYAAAIPRLVELSRAKHGTRRPCIVKALASVGRDDGGVAPVLVGFLNDDDPAVRRAAVRGLSWQEPSDEHFAAIAPLTVDPDEQVRTDAEYTRQHLEVRKRLGEGKSKPNR